MNAREWATFRKQFDDRPLKIDLEDRIDALRYALSTNDPKPLWTSERHALSNNDPRKSIVNSGVKFNPSALMDVQGGEHFKHVAEEIAFFDRFDTFKSCVHQWETYTGFTEIFDYCTKCDRRK